MFGGRKLVTEIDKNFMTTYAKVATHDGDDEPIQIWAKDEKSYGGVGTDKLGIWGSVVAVDFDICVADGACIEACPVDVYDWLDTPNHPASDKKAIMSREPDCIICRACEEVCPVVAVLITDPGDIGSDTEPAETIEEKEETATSASNTVSETAVATTETASLFFHKPNKWLNKAKDVLSKEELPTTGIEKAKSMFKDLRKQTLDSLPRGKEYMALVDNEKCIGCTQCVYFCNFASIDMISWDLQARTSQFESKKALILDDACTGCTLCAFACPVEAITMEARV
ncbi:MAG: hypothetical protein CXT75_09750 [Methanobacteriota archaeon]|nr:MAG: hypothetical protein CXT75_09750 [Euryarchaeota archaeon]